MQGNKVVDLSSYFLLSAAQKGTALVNFTLPYVQWKQRKRGKEYGILANIRKHLSTVRVTDHWHSLPRKVVSSPLLGDFRKLSGHGSGQVAVHGPA